MAKDYGVRERRAPRDLRGELERDDGTFAPAWKPEDGDVLCGTVERYSHAPAKFGDVLIATIRDERTDEAVAVWLSRTVLLEEFKRTKPRVGERVGVKFFGQPNGVSYFKYRVVVDRPDEVPDFDSAPTPDDADAPGDWKFAKDAKATDNLPPEADAVAPVADDDIPF